MKVYFLDTTVIIDYLRGREEAIRLIDSLDGKITSSYFCLAELYEGIYASKNKKAEEAIVTFFSGLSKIFSLNKQVAKKFGEVRFTLRNKGKTIEDIDIFIAATCLTYDLILITYNKKHFERIVGLCLA